MPNAAYGCGSQSTAAAAGSQSLSALPRNRDLNGAAIIASDGLRGVVISHPHIDHYGLLHHLTGDVPVAIGSAARQIIQAAHQAAEDGRVHAVLLDDPMPDRDLEKVASGKETIGRANRTLDTIDVAARDIGTAARSGDAMFQQGSRFLGS